MIKKKDLKNINIVCFGLDQYDCNIIELYVNVWANYKNDTIYSPDIVCGMGRYGIWNEVNNKWEIIDYKNEITDLGIEMILDYLNGDYQQEKYYE